MKFKRTAILLLLISIGYFATDIYLPSLPSLAADFQVSRESTQLTLFAYMLSFALTPLLFGPLSDHLGRKKVVYYGLFISLLATIGCILSPSIYFFIACRFLQGMGNGAIMIAGRSMVSDLFKGRELATQISYITMSLPLVLAVAPTIGGCLQEAYNWQAPFCFLLFYIFLVGFASLKIDESLDPAGKRHISTMFTGYKEILSKPLFILFGLGVALPAVGTLAYLTFSPFLFQEILGLSPAQYGSLAIPIGAAIIMASYLNIRLLHLVPINTILWIGSGFVIAAGAMLLLCHLAGILNTWVVMIATMMYFFSFPLIGTNSVSKALSQIKQYMGGANALLSSVQFIAGSIGSLLFSFIPVKNALPLALCYLGVGLATVCLLFFANRHEKR